MELRNQKWGRLLPIGRPSSLDPELVAEVLQVMRELAHSGITVLVDTHEMGFAREAADRIVFVADGIIVCDLPPTEAFDNNPHPRVRAFNLSRARDAYAGRFEMRNVSEHYPVGFPNIGNYFRIAPDNRLIWGGRARFALSNPESDAKSGRILESGLRHTFPQLGRVRIDY